MKIEKFTIANFRSIAQARIQCKEFNILVGSNNSGKSNFLQALLQFFDPYRRFEENDLYSQTRSRTIRLKAKLLLETKRDRRLFTQTYQLARLTDGKHVILEKRGTPEAETKYLCFFGSKKKVVTREQIPKLRRYFRREFLMLDLLADRTIDFQNLEEVLGQRHIRNLGRYIRENTEKDLEPGFRRLNRYLSSYFAPLRRACKRYFHLPEDRFNFTASGNIAEILSRMRFEIDLNDSSKILSTKGQGIKDIVLFLFQGLFDPNRLSVCALEEPETHLHPSMIRGLVDAVQRMKAKKQFFITSHHCEVINLFNPNYINRFIMENGTTKIISPHLKDKTIVNFYKHVFSRHSEVLLAKKVLLVEGDTEVRAIPALSNKISFEHRGRLISGSLDVHGVKVVQVFGKAFHGPVPFLKAYNLDFLVLGDNDKWPDHFIKFIEKTGLARKHPNKYTRLVQLRNLRLPLNKEIRSTMYKYFKIIALHKDFEHLITTAKNATWIRKLFKQYFPERYRDVKRVSPQLKGINLCIKLMQKEKPQWSILIGRRMPSRLISDEFKVLLKLVVLQPKNLNF